MARFEPGISSFLIALAEADEEKDAGAGACGWEYRRWELDSPYLLRICPTLRRGQAGRK